MAIAMIYFLWILGILVLFGFLYGVFINIQPKINLDYKWQDIRLWDLSFIIIPVLFILRRLGRVFLYLFPFSQNRKVFREIWN